MTLQQAVTLISPAAPHLATDHPVSSSGQSQAGTNSPDQPRIWADLGCGSGLFTSALAQLLPQGSTIYGIDTDPTLRQQSTPVAIKSLTADFVTDPLDLPLLHGILMANSLHYVKDKPALISKLRTYMRPYSPFIIIEYDTDQPVPTWVPYPISFNSLTRLFSNVQKLGQRPSVFGRANIYAALARP